MTFFEFCYMTFGIIDLFIVLIGPIYNMISRKNRNILLVYITILTYTLRYFFPILSTYIVLISTFVLIYFFTKRKIALICLSLFNYLLSIVLNYTSLMLLEHLFGITEIDAITTYYIPYYLFLTVLFLISSYTIRQLYNHALGYTLQIPTATTILLLIYLVICAVMFIYNYTYEESLGFPQDIVRVNTFLFSIFFLITGIFIAALIYVLKKDAKIQAQNVQYESLQQYTAQVEELYQNIRGFKHDYVNILTTMHTYMENEDWEALRTYYESEIIPTTSTFRDSSQVLGLLSNLQIPELKSILYNKFVKALELDITVHFEIRRPIAEISAKNIDIARVIGIYLDNAIEALSEPEVDADHRNLWVAFIENEESVVIIIQNDCKEFLLNPRKLGTISYSTKGENRGMGLHLASQTLRHYKNIQNETTYENHIFTQTLTIFKE